MDLYYTNFVLVKYYNKDLDSWRRGIAHHEWILDYSGFAVKLDNFNDDDIIELSWRDLRDD